MAIIGVDYVLIFALQKELEAFLKQLPSYQTTKTDIVSYKSNIEGHTTVALSLPQMGNYEAATITTRAIDVWKPQHVILGGIAGGIKAPSIMLGDIIVADLIVGYEPGKQYEDGLKRRVRKIEPAQELIKNARALHPSSWALSAKVARPDGADKRTIPSVHFGTIVSGEKVIADAQWITELAKDIPKPIKGVEMEAYGTALAAYRASTRPGMLVAKAFCDWADSEKNDDWQEYAAAVSAAFIVALIKATPIFAETNLNIPQRKDTKSFSGKSKIKLCRRLGDDWQDLADYFEIEIHIRRRFQHGRECQGVWEYIESRQRLDGLPQALTWIGREDLLNELTFE